jgi:DUF917 family protein
MSFELTQTDVLDVCAGACLLGSGGGGSYVVAKRLVRRGIRADQKVMVVEPSDLKADAYLCICADMGAPHLAFSQPSLYAPGNAVGTLSEIYFPLVNAREARFEAVCSIEIGAINTVVSLVVAAQRNLVAVNADGAGRAVPRLEMLLYAAYGEANGFPIFPNSVASDGGPGEPIHAGFIKIGGPRPELGAEVAFFGLAATQPFGELCGLAIWPMQARAMQQHAPVLGSIYDSLKIGRIVGSGQSGAMRVAEIGAYLGGRRQPGYGPRRSKTVFHGYITNMTQKAGSLDIGQIVVSAEPDGSGDVLTIYYQNENLLASLASDPTKPHVMGPDTIALVPATPIGTPAQNVVDNSDLFNLWQWGVRPLEVYVVAIEAPVIVKENSTLVNNWLVTLNQMLGYTGHFDQPWLTTAPAGAAAV